MGKVYGPPVDRLPCSASTFSNRNRGSSSKSKILSIKEIKEVEKKEKVAGRSMSSYKGSQKKPDLEE